MSGPDSLTALHRLVVRAHRHLVMRGVPKQGEATYLKLMDDLLAAVEGGEPRGERAALGEQAIALLYHGVRDTWYSTPELNFRDWQNAAKQFVDSLPDEVIAALRSPAAATDGEDET